MNDLHDAALLEAVPPVPFLPPPEGMTQETLDGITRAALQQARFDLNRGDTLMFLQMSDRLAQREAEWRALRNALREDGATPDYILRQETRYWIGATIEDNVAYADHGVPTLPFCPRHHRRYYGLCRDCLRESPPVSLAALLESEESPVAPARSAPRDRFFAKVGGWLCLLFGLLCLGAVVADVLRDGERAHFEQVQAERELAREMTRADR